jgi:hypothetical protein
MAIEIISGNLNTLGNNGNFETDPSTWGAGSPLGTLARSLTAFLGTFSCQVTLTVGTATVPRYFAAQISPPPVVIGNKYLVRARVRVPAGFLPVGGTRLLKLEWFEPGVPYANVLFSTFRTVSDCVDTWQELELGVEIVDDTSPLVCYVTSETNAAFGVVAGGVLLIDKFEVFQFVEVADPCTLEINSGGTVVVNESSPGANNGSIQVAVTGGTAPFEYSKNGGTTWQSSNLFTGLAPGIYNMVVREQARISCNSSQTFAINAAAVTHSFTTSVTNETVLGANDGMIAVTVSGTGGPFTFSKDGGVTYQAGNVFTGLAPGTYTIVVRNAALNILAANVTVLPGITVYDKIYWSKNPIPFSVQAPANWQSLVNLRMYCEVQVEDVAGSGVFNSKMKMSLYPASNGECLFNLRQALRSVFSLTPPAINNNTIVKLTDRAKAFKVITDTMEGDVVTPTLPVTTSKTMLALYGGLSTYAHAVSNFFTDLATTKKFLSWQPDNKLLDAFQEDYLNFLVYDVAITSINLEAKAYYDDGTNQTAVLKTQAGVKYGELYQLPVGTANSGVKTINAAKTLVKYEVRLLNESAAAISEVRTFLVAPVTHPLTRFIMLINSLGAHEVHLMTGEAKKTKEVSKEMIQKYLPPLYNALQGQFENTEGSFISKVNYSTGLFTQSNAAEWQQYMVDLLMSKIAYETVGTNRYPLVIETGSIVADEDRVYEKFVRFDAINSYIDKAYTPQ